MTAPQLPISRIVPVVAHAVAVFGDEHKASHWLSIPLPLLENHAPSDLVYSDEGIQRVETILTRIEHNTFLMPLTMCRIFRRISIPQRGAG